MDTHPQAHTHTQRGKLKIKLEWGSLEEERMKPDVETETGKEKERDGAIKKEKKRKREVCVVFYEADLDRELRELDTLRLWRKTVSAAEDCVCVCACLYMFTANCDVPFWAFYGIKMSLKPNKSSTCARVCMGGWKEREKDEVNEPNSPCGETEIQ